MVNTGSCFNLSSVNAHGMNTVTIRGAMDFDFHSVFRVA